MTQKQKLVKTSNYRYIIIISSLDVRSESSLKKSEFRSYRIDLGVTPWKSDP